jgi:hypothetical protein
VSCPRSAWACPVAASPPSQRSDPALERSGASRPVRSQESLGPGRRCSRQIPGKGIAYSATAAKAIAKNTTVQTIHARDLCCGTWLMRAIVSGPQPDSERTSCIQHGSDVSGCERRVPCPRLGVGMCSRRLVVSRRRRPLTPNPSPARGEGCNVGCRVGVSSRQMAIDRRVGHLQQGCAVDLSDRVGRHLVEHDDLFGSLVADAVA